MYVCVRLVLCTFPFTLQIADEMYHHSLTGIVDGALRNSNAQYESADVLERLGVYLLPTNAGDRGWEVFSLDYRVEPPLTSVIHPKARETYRQVMELLCVYGVVWCKYYVCVVWSSVVRHNLMCHVLHVRFVPYVLVCMCVCVDRCSTCCGA